MSTTKSLSLRTGSALALISTLVLAGCDEHGQFVAMQATDRGTSVTGTPASGTRSVERDVEAPEVFSASEAGLWDGRPSLGGVWVAHPDVTEPERVIIRNVTNSKFVVGALFRRERDIPGPRLQVSSDAAEALGMLAGAPVELNVTALRKETVEETPEDAAAEAETVAAPAEVETATLDPIGAAAAALDAPAAAPAPVPVPAIASAAVPAPVQTAAAAPSSLAKPYIQIGFFSVEANAARTANRMRDAGIVPLTKTYEKDGKTFWRVVVGPAKSGAQRSQLLEKVRAEGFTDAYAVTN